MVASNRALHAHSSIGFIVVVEPGIRYSCLLARAIEAGIEEFKGTFYVGHMRFFTVEAVWIQEQLITFLPNFIRWAIPYYFDPNAIHLPSRAELGLEQLECRVLYL